MILFYTMSDKQANIVMSGWLKKKGSTFGFWHKRFVYIRENRLFISKTDSLTDFDRYISINVDTEVILSTNSSPPRITIKPANEKQIILSAPDEDSINQWALAIRALSLITPNVSMQNIEIKSVIGRGFYGKVMLCKYKTTGEFVAVKTIHKNRLIKENKVHTIFSERNVLLKAKHPFIISLLFAFQNDTKVYLGLEYAAGGELFHHIQKRGLFPLSEVRLIIAELALALNFLHQNRIVYRDLKPENILFDSNGFVKLTDFGLAKDLNNDSLTTTFCGTSEYVAPELLYKKAYGPAVDWWALGILTFELLVGKTPFYNENKEKMFQQIRIGRPKFPPSIEPNAISLISGLLEKDPEERYGFESLLSHPFFDGLNFDDVLHRRVLPEFIPDSTHGEIPKNFDSKFVAEVPLDSMATPIPKDRIIFEGFSFVNESSESPDLADPDDSILTSPIVQSWI